MDSTAATHATGPWRRLRGHRKSSARLHRRPALPPAGRGPTWPRYHAPGRARTPWWSLDPPQCPQGSPPSRFRCRENCMVDLVDHGCAHPIPPEIPRRHLTAMKPPVVTALILEVLRQELHPWLDPIDLRVPGGKRWLVPCGNNISAQARREVKQLLEGKPLESWYVGTCGICINYPESIGKNKALIIESCFRHS